ncbi:uncharacterized protein LOC132205135 [Neocloeon triangulifer]|uniref:uncharacterized protein LOC132205135 n=1 Tax=Neocloeon triangulifer TaxID=2078957 RepID=UPI00286EC409|nr:uncharacterized protein LOC132205135 [Neocloeon triangulifer]
MSTSIPNEMSSIHGPLLSAPFPKVQNCGKKSKKKKNGAVNGHNGTSNSTAKGPDFQFSCPNKPEFYQFTAVSTPESSSDLFLDEISADDPHFMELLTMMLEENSLREDQEIAFEAFVSSLSQHPPEQHKRKSKQLVNMIAKRLIEIDYEGDSDLSGPLVATNAADSSSKYAADTQIDLSKDKDERDTKSKLDTDCGASPKGSKKKTPNKSDSNCNQSSLNSNETQESDVINPSCNCTKRSYPETKHRRKRDHQTNPVKETHFDEIIQMLKEDQIRSVVWFQNLLGVVEQLKESFVSHTLHQKSVSPQITIANGHREVKKQPSYKVRCRVKSKGRKLIRQRSRRRFRHLKASDCSFLEEYYKYFTFTQHVPSATDENFEELMRLLLLCTENDDEVASQLGKYGSTIHNLIMCRLLGELAGDFEPMGDSLFDFVEKITTPETARRLNIFMCQYQVVTLVHLSIYLITTVYQIDRQNNRKVTDPECAFNKHSFFREFVSKIIYWYHNTLMDRRKKLQLPILSTYCRQRKKLLREQAKISAARNHQNMRSNAVTLGHFKHLVETYKLADQVRASIAADRKLKTAAVAVKGHTCRNVHPDGSICSHSKVAKEISLPSDSEDESCSESEDEFDSVMRRIETPPPPPQPRGPSTPPPAQTKPAPKKPVKKNRKQERKNKRAAEKLEKARQKATVVKEVPQLKGRPLLPRKKKIIGTPLGDSSRKNSACTSTTEDDFFEQLDELPLEENSFRLVWQDGKVYLDYRLDSKAGEQLELSPEFLKQYKIPENVMFDSVTAPVLDSDSCAVMEKAAILENPCMEDFRGFIKSLGLEI